MLAVKDKGEPRDDGAPGPEPPNPYLPNGRTPFGPIAHTRKGCVRFAFERVSGS